MLRSLLRFAEIIYVFALYLPPYPFAWWRERSFGERLCAAFMQLGLVWVKLGQALAGRKVLSGASQTGLEKIYDRNPPVPFATVRAVAERMLGMPLEAYFDTFDEEPIDTASIGQVHVCWRHGTQMVMKVRKPGVSDRVQQDVHIMRMLISLFSLVSKRGRSIRSGRIPEQVAEWLRQEMDFRIEAENLRRFAKAFAEAPFDVPEVDFESEELLVETFDDGISVLEWKEEYRVQGYDPQASVYNFIKYTFGPAFRGISLPVHADPNPKNLKIRKGGRMGILDFGLVGYLTERELMMMNETIFAVYLGKPKRTVKTTLRMCGDYEFPTERKKRAFAADIQKFVRRAPHEPFGFWLTESSRLLTKHGVPVPPVLAIIGRFGIVGDGVVQTFFPHSSTAELIGDDMEAGIFQQMLRKTFKKGSWLLLLDALAERAERAPKDAADFVRDPLKTVADAVEAVIKPFKKAA